VELACDEGSEEGANADVGDEVSGGTHAGSIAGVVAVLRVIEGSLHEGGEGDGSFGLDPGCDLRLED
jgi:hypothetical protein